MRGPVNLLLSARKLKLALVAAIAAFALGGAGIALAAAVTPSPKAPSPSVTATHPSTTDTNNANPDAFGQKVEARVDFCKTQRPHTGGHQGIGQCVSSWVKTHNPSNTNPASSNKAGTAHSGH